MCWLAWVNLQKPKFIFTTPHEETTMARREGAKYNIMYMFPYPPIAEKEEVIKMSSQEVNGREDSPKTSNIILDEHNSDMVLQAS
jgi:hypothetical protein